MWNATLRTAAVLAAAAPMAQLSLADEAGMVRLAGTPEQIGTIWGTMNKTYIATEI